VQDHLSIDHEFDDQLELYALDRLSETDVIPLEEHLMVCEPCREKLEHIAAFAYTMRDVLKEHPLPVAEPKSSLLDRISSAWNNLAGANWKPQAALAGVFAVVVLSVGVWQMNKPSGSTMLPAAASLQLTAMRGDMPSVNAAQELSLQVGDAPESGSPFRMELVNDAGAAVWTGQPNASGHSLTATIHKPVPAGVYFARLYDGSGKLLHEYGFRVAAKP
jgi:hypothetical protein